VQSFNWHNVALARPLSERLGLPVILENDGNTLTAVEQWFGLGHGVDHFIVIVVGSGIGAGIASLFDRERLVTGNKM
jgi:glucokinase